MKLLLSAFFLFSLSISALNAGSIPKWQKKSGWKDIEIYAKANGGTSKDLKDVTPKTLGAYWAGRITKFYWSKPQNKVTKIKVKVTWSSPRGKPCGKNVVLPIDGYKDLNYRSMAMKRCK